MRKLLDIFKEIFDEAPKKPLFEMIEEHYGSAITGTVRRFFESAGLPEPQGDDYFHSVDSGILIFLNDEACVIRLAGDKLNKCGPLDKDEPGYAAPNIDEDILQPVGLKDLGDHFYIEVMPGVPVGTSTEAYNEILQRLEAKGFEKNDEAHFAHRNAGLLPDGTPVIIDRGAVRALSDAVKQVKDSLGRQDQYYGGLKTLFARAWPEGTPAPDNSQMAAFWQKCREMKQENILVASWQKPEKGTAKKDRMDKYANSYQARRDAATNGRAAGCDLKASP